MDEEQPTVICAWCGRIVSAHGTTLTHGICGPCANELLAVIEQQTREGGQRERPASERGLAPE